MPKKYADSQIGQPGPGQYGYVALLNGGHLDIYTDGGLAQARRDALAFWKPFKKDLPYLVVGLAELPGGEPVIHTADV